MSLNNSLLECRHDRSSGTASRYPLVPAKMIATWRSTGQRLVLRLLQNFDEPRAAVELRLRGLCRGRCRTGAKAAELAVLREVEPQRFPRSAASP